MLKMITDDTRLSGFLGVFIAILAIFFIAPIVTTNFFAHLILQLAFITLIISVMYSLCNNRSTVWIGLGCIIFFVLFDTISLLQHSMGYMLIAYAFSLFFTLFAVVLLTRKILLAPRIDTNLIFGALTIYLLAGIFWAKIYFLENALLPGSFQKVVGFDLGNLYANAYEMQFNFIYYSFTILTTLGLGDITPIHHLAKSLTVLEAVFGQLYIAIIIAKIVSVWRNSTVK